MYLQIKAYKNYLRSNVTNRDEQYYNINGSDLQNAHFIEEMGVWHYFRPFINSEGVVPVIFLNFLIAVVR
jgi:hypothetical protein